MGNKFLKAIKLYFKCFTHGYFFRLIYISLYTVTRIKYFFVCDCMESGLFAFSNTKIPVVP